MSDTPKLLALMAKSRDLPALEYSKQLKVLVRELEKENAALREALQNCAISASGQNWQQIAWIVEGALYDPRKEAQP